MDKVPGFFNATTTVAYLQWIKLRRGRGLLLSSIAVIAVVGAAALARRFAKDADAAELMQSTVSLGFFGLLVYLLPFLFAAGAISEDVEARTVSFTLSRPLSRSALLLGKFLTAALSCAALLCLGVLSLHLFIYLPDMATAGAQLGQSLAFMASLCALSTVYCAICLFWGSTAVEASGVLCVMYLAVVEFALGHILPGPSRMVSLNYHAKQLVGLPKGGLFAPEMTPDLPLFAHAGILFGALAAFLLLAALILSRGEYVTEQS